MANGKETDLDKIFCLNAKKYDLEKLWLKAIAIVESSLNPRAYRFEQGFWDKYLKNHSEWKDKDPKIVSASYGLMQLMWTTAHALGFRGTVEDLYNPVFNIELGAKLLRQTLDKVACNKVDRLDVKYKLHPFAIANARYNGGAIANPSEDGKLRNQAYVNKVFDEWYRLIKTEKECDDENNTKAE